MDYKDIKKRRQEARKKRNRRKKFIAISVVIISALSITILTVNNNEKKNTVPQNSLSKVNTDSTDIQKTSAQNSTPAPSSSPTPTVSPASTATITPTPVPTPTPIMRRGTAQPIPEEIRTYMTGLSYRQNSNISLDDLSYLTIPHYDFNYNVTEGHLIVNNMLAEEVLDIFAELFDIKYPIERMELVDNYGADDYQSIEYNNTSAFNYRLSTSGSGNLSRHALGRAIDINPQINPYVSSNGTGAHQNAAEYWSRDTSKWTSDVAKAAYIGPGTEIYNIFTKRGWTWGGNWSSYRDYQHFEK